MICLCCNGRTYRDEICNTCLEKAESYDSLKAQHDKLVEMIAKWCFLVDKNGTSWDDWDEGYKDAAYRETDPICLRQIIDEKIEELKNGR